MCESFFDDDILLVDDNNLQDATNTKMPPTQRDKTVAPHSLRAGGKPLRSEIAQYLAWSLLVRDIVASVMHLGPVYPHTVNTDRFANGPWATARQVRHALRGTHADCCGIE